MPHTRVQLAHARSMLKRRGLIPIEDRDGYSGALGMLRGHLGHLAGQPPTKQALLAEVHRLCKRPGFDVERAYCPSERAYRPAWIEASTISSHHLGRPFKPYHYTSAGLAEMALRILSEQGDPDGLAFLFGHPRRPTIVVWSVPGPLGPIRPITLNGNHRTIALRALGVPVVLAEVRPWVPPYRCRVRSEREWHRTWPFLEWLHEHGAIRLSPRPVVETGAPCGFTREIRVSDAPAPWLLAPPRCAVRALEVYEALKGARIEHVGRLNTSLLRGRWSHI